MSANFTPELNSYTDLTPFRYWCQKVLPLVYDDSLSYYELLCKVIDYLNKTMEDVNLAVEDVGKLHDAYDSLQAYVNTYFENLNVQEEINNKLDEMVEDGTIRNIFSEDVQDILDVASDAAEQAIADIPENVTDWLEEHITQETGYVIDDTLTVQGAAADAKKTGDEISALKSDMNVIAVLNYPDKTVKYGLFNDQEIQYWNQTAQRIIRVECDGNTKYTISKTLGDSFEIGCTASAPAVGVAILGYYSHSENTGNVEYTTPESAQYLLIHCAIQASSATNEQLLADVTIFTITGGKDNVARAEINAISQAVEELNGDVSDLTDDVSDLTDDVDSIKAALGDFANINTSPNLYNPNDPDVSDNTYINPDGTQETYNGRKVSGFIPVIPGEVVKFSREGASYSFSSTCFYSSDKSVVSGGVYNSSSVSVPSGAKYVRVTFPSGSVDVQIECNSTGSVSPYQPFGTTANLILDDTFTSEEFPPSAKATLEKINDEIDDLDGQIKTTVTCKNLYNPDDPDVAQNTYINPNGTVETVSGRTVTGFMPVKPGKKVVLSRLNETIRETMTWASICFYDASKNVVSGGQYNTNRLTVPNGAAYARVTFSTTFKDVQIECNDTGDMSGYEAYFPAYTVLNSDIKVQVDNVLGIDSIKQIPDSYRWKGAITAGDTIKLPVTNVKNQQIYAFSGNISTLDKIKIGRIFANGTTYGAFEVDGTNVKFYCDDGTTETHPHGLNIQNNIQIELATENTFNLSKALLTSNGIQYDILANFNTKRFIGDEGAPFVQSTGSALSDCSFSWTSRNIAKPIWMFGDSYMSLYNVRWVYYLIRDGYDKSCLINAYAGEASDAALASMQNLFALSSKPKYILWALGMNNPDTASAVNAAWKACYDTVIDLCERNGIIPVLATIPNTPTNNNTYKNAIVKSSGYRYIDFASAVGATEAESGWYSGMLNSDNVHPNIPGAIALYYQALADFPELTSA